MRQILFPVDFSEQCDLTAPAVAATARQFGAAVTLLHVVRLPAFRTEFAPYKDHFRTIIEEFEGGLREYQRDVWAGISVDPLLRMGDPVHEIVEFARIPGVDLMMMPTRGSTRFRQLLLGSVTAGVLHDTECPVWTTAHAEAATPFQPYRSVLCAIDLGHASVAVLRQAGLFASRYGAPLHVMHVSGFSGARVQCESLVAEAGVSPADIHVAAGNVVDAVFASELRVGADLLVIGRGRIQGPLGRLRTNAHDIIRLSRCPVLSV